MITQNRTSETKQKRWYSKSAGNNMLCSWGHSDHSLQRSNNIQPNSFTPNYTHHHRTHFRFTWGRNREKLDPWLRLFDRSLFVLVWMACFASTRLEKIPSSSLCHFLHLFLWNNPICHHRCHCRA